MKRILIFLLFTCFTTNLFAKNPVLNAPISQVSPEVSKPEVLRDFPNVEQFEEYLNLKLTSCLDQSYGGTKALRCYSSYNKAWDNELNYYYKLLRAELNTKDRKTLKSAQLSWIKYRDSTMRFNSSVLSKKYEGQQGTMYMAMSAGDAADVLSPIIKARVLRLKAWYEETIALVDEKSINR